jgi:2-iminobutanoate/2-iminopropanoate deaminase
MVAARLIREVHGRPDRDPVPLGVRIGDLVFSLAIAGNDLDTGEYPAGLRAQLEQAFRNLRALVEGGGGAMENVARVTMFVDDLADRDAIEEPWVSAFPDSADRPARKTLRAPLPAGCHVQLEALAVLGERRERFDIPGVGARDPTVRLGDWLFSSRLHGARPSGEVADGPDAQARVALDHVETLLDLGGRSWDDLQQITLFLKDSSYRDAAEGAWRERLADGRRAPRLHLMRADMPQQFLVMAELLAAFGGSSGLPVAEVFDEPNRDPRPVGFRTGEIALGRVVGTDRESGQLGRDLEEQLAFSFQNLRSFVESAGGSTDDVAHVTLFMPDLSERLAFNPHWTGTFPDAADRPPFKYMPAPLPAGELLQLQVIAVLGGRRRVLAIPGVEHRDPMPLAVHMGDWVFSSRIMGTDPETTGQPQTPARQAELALAHIRSLLAQAGARPDQVSQVTAFTTDHAFQGTVDALWRVAFPDPSRAPTLHRVTVDLPGPQVRLDFIAWVS